MSSELGPRTPKVLNSVDIILLGFSMHHLAHILLAFHVSVLSNYLIRSLSMLSFRNLLSLGHGEMDMKLAIISGSQKSFAMC